VAIMRQSGPVPSVTVRLASTIGGGEILVKHEIVQELRGE